MTVPNNTESLKALQPALEFPHFGSDTVHEQPDARTGAVVTPLSLSTTFKQVSPGVHEGYEYSRSGNPTRNNYEENLARVENGKHAITFSSGLAATTSIVLGFLQSGDHMVSMDDVYGGTRRFFSRILHKFGVETSYADTTDLGNLKAALRVNTKLVWLESPTNPMLRITDIAAAVEVVRAFNKDIILVVDNTFMSPYNQRPLDLGADVVMHSITKFLNGHSDVVMGCAVLRDDDLAEKLRFVQNGMGGVPAPFDCYLANRGLKTLAVRMRQHNINAMALAKHMEASPLVEKVLYPGLPSHPQHAVMAKQCQGFGGMITILVKGGVTEAKLFLENLKVFTLAESLGGVESLAEHPAIMTHASVPAEERTKLGIFDNLVRLSVGIEETQDLIDDVQNALEIAVSKKISN